MSTAPKTQTTKVDQFFTGAEARHDRWRKLLQQARLWEAAARQNQKETASNRSQVAASLEELKQWEDFYAYPGPVLLNVLNDRVNSGDAVGSARLIRTISTAIVTHSYRGNVGEWDKEDDSVGNLSDRLPLSSEQKAAHRPYFEVLFVSPARQ